MKLSKGTQSLMHRMKSHTRSMSAIVSLIEQFQHILNLDQTCQMQHKISAMTRDGCLPCCEDRACSLTSCKLQPRLGVHFPPLFCLIFLLYFASLLENLKFAAISHLFTVVHDIS